MSIAQRKDVRAWAKRLKRLVEQTPQGTRVFVANSVVYVLEENEQGCLRMLKDGGVDPEAILQRTYSNGLWDGGDF